VGSIRLRFFAEGLLGIALTVGLLWLLEGWFGVGGLRPVTHQGCGDDRIVIAAVGDMLIGDQAQRRLDRQGYDYPFRSVGHLLEGADLVMGNLEAPITLHDELYYPDKKWFYKQNPEVAGALRDAGFDVLALANNHALDYSHRGMQDTIRYLHDVGIGVIGAGGDELQAREGLVVEIEGTRVGLLAYMEPYGRYPKDKWFADGDRGGPARMDKDTLREDIARMREQADVVIVHLHAGRNYKGVTGYQKRLGRAAIDLGADAVAGHHSHVAQGVEIHRGKPIVYSLGNFTFGTGGRFGRKKQGYGLVARFVLCEGELNAVELDLIGTNNAIVKFRPTVIPETEARSVMTDLMEPFGTELRWNGSTAIIDLTGSRRAFLDGR